MLTPGTELGGRYRLDTRIASGGMGDMWRAEDSVLGRIVAIKVLLPQLLEEPGFAERFRGEARVMATINHPGVVDVYDFGEGAVAGGGSVVYLVMEFIEGDALSKTLDRVGRLTGARTMALMAQAADALQAAHDKGIIHRDVKPGNLMVRPNGTLVLIDFGIARSAMTGQLTAVGSVLGTAAYISPEQAGGAQVTPLADVYSLGVVAYQCLAGRRPYEGDNPLDIALRHVRDNPPPLPTDVPQPAREVVERAMAKDPTHRWRSAADLASAARRAAAAVHTATSGGMPPAPGIPVVPTFGPHPGSPVGPTSAPPGPLTSGPTSGAPAGAPTSGAPTSVVPAGAAGPGPASPGPGPVAPTSGQPGQPGPALPGPTSPGPASPGPTAPHLSKPAVAPTSGAPTSAPPGPVSGPPAGPISGPPGAPTSGGPGSAATTALPWHGAPTSGPPGSPASGPPGGHQGHPGHAPGQAPGGAPQFGPVGPQFGGRGGPGGPGGPGGQPGGPGGRPMAVEGGTAVMPAGSFVPGGAPGSGGPAGPGHEVRLGAYQLGAAPVTGPRDDHTGVVEPPKRSVLLIVLLVVAIVVVLGAVGMLAYYGLSSGNGGGGPTPGPSAEQGEALIEVPCKAGNGMPQDTRKILEEKGFRTEFKDRDYDLSKDGRAVSKGMVIEFTPGCTKKPKGSLITIWVSTGKATTGPRPTDQPTNQPSDPFGGFPT